MSALVKVSNLSVSYTSKRGRVMSLQSVTLDIDRGSSLGIVGESGSGKSTFALSLLGLLPQAAEVTGSILIDGNQLVRASQGLLSQVRGGLIGLVYQDALVSLNPVRRVGPQLREMALRHRTTDAQEAVRLSVDALANVGISQPDVRYNQFPHEFSGGMRQRALIAMALVASPKLLIADEITTALDVTVQAQILDLIQFIQATTSMTTIVISHDLEVVKDVTTHLAVFYGGRVVEYGATDDILTAPCHPYTAALLACAPSLEHPKLSFIPGNPPRGVTAFTGCAFRDRCPLGHDRQICGDIVPPLAPSALNSHVMTACHFSNEIIKLREPAPSNQQTGEN